MMPLHKVRKLDEESAGVTLPKGDLQVDGVLSRDGELAECFAHIRHVGDRRFELELILEDDLA